MKTMQGSLFGEPDILTVTLDSTTSFLEKMGDNAFSRYCEKHYALISKLEEIGLPLPGQQIRLVTRRVFNAIQFIEYITKTEVIIDIKMAIFSINFNAAKILLKLINDGKIRNAEILMSNLRNKAHREKEEIVKNMFTDHPKVSLFFCSSHAKVFACQTLENNFYTLEGSGNMGYNSRVEQYVIDNDQEMYLFTCRWMAEIKDFLKGTKELELTDDK